MEIVQYPRGRADQALRAQLIELENTAWPSDVPAEKEVFPVEPDTYVTSFVLMADSAAVCHVAVRRKRLLHKGDVYLAYGLSEVVTHPDWRGRGLGTRLLRHALKFIERQEPDISLFTCAADRVSFYTRGGWSAMPGTCLVGGTEAEPFRSDALGLTVMARFHSVRAESRRADFENADIYLRLGKNQLW